MITVFTEKVRPEWMPAEQEELDLRRHDLIRVHLPDGSTFDGEIRSANNYCRHSTDFPQWYIEMTVYMENGRPVTNVHGQPGAYGYWKQGSDSQKIDGGWVEEIFVPTW